LNEITLANRVQRVKPSPTLSITARVAELRAAGKDIIGLGAGEPDFDTPEHIRAAAIEAINSGFTRYTAVDGTPELKKAIIAKFRRDNGLEYTPEQILVSCGGKQSFFNLCQSLLNSGDEVIIPAPYWVSYPDTRLVVINSPSNPTGVAYTRDELAALGEVLRAYPQVLIATDDMYEHILWSEEPFSNILNPCPDLYDRTIVLNGVSKVYAMTGWRIGYAGGPAPLIRAMKKVQSQSTSNPTSISQVAAQAALEGDQSCIAPMIKAFRERHDFVIGALNRIPGVECLPADGTFYCFPKVQSVIDRLDNVSDDIELAEYLLDTAGVALVPGSAFGAPGYVRLSFATGLDVLEDALARLTRALTP
jgi:aspartate aminotransferase